MLGSNSIRKRFCLSVEEADAFIEISAESLRRNAVMKVMQGLLNDEAYRLLNLSGSDADVLACKHGYDACQRLTRQLEIILEQAKKQQK